MDARNRVARYFTRNVVDIKLTAEEQVPDVQSVDQTYRNKIEIMNSADGCVFFAGNSITFEGVADDLGSPIEAIEFSLRRQRNLDRVPHRRRYRRQMGELAVRDFVRRSRRVSAHRSRSHD